MRNPFHNLPESAQPFHGIPPNQIITYRMASPLATHFAPPRRVPCDEFGCPEYLNGWRSPIDESTPLGQAQANYIRRSSGRRFTEGRTPDGRTLFIFDAGQMPFASLEHEHLVYRSLEREPLYIVRRGDWRNLGVIRRHAKGEDWRDDFATHQQRRIDEQNGRG